MDKPVKIFKFGGASLKEVAAVENVGRILSGYQGDKLVVVVSAMAKNTDVLEEIVAAHQRQDGTVQDKFRAFCDWHAELMDQLFEPGNEVFANVNDPTTFQYAGPASWNAYWRHYFDALRTADANGVPIREWAAGFQEFASTSGNRHFEINGTIAVAAAEFFSGNKDAAELMMYNVGFPCEGHWKFIGPFKMKKGFHQKGRRCCR